MNLLNNNLFFIFLIFIGVILVITSSLMIYEEIKGSKSFCESVNGTYSYNLTEKQHLCNQKPIFQYTDGWNFNKTIEFLYLTPTKP